MKPAFGVTDMVAETIIPARKRAAKKTSAKKSTKKVEDTEEQIQAVSDAHDGDKPKRTRRTEAEMLAAGEVPRSKRLPTPSTGVSKSVIQMRREAERLVAKADAAEAKEILTEARNHVKDLEREAKDLTKQLAANEKSLEKAKSLLHRLEGPGE